MHLFKELGLDEDVAHGGIARKHSKHPASGLPPLHAFNSLGHKVTI